jgi:hypothetical protein
MLSGIDQLRNLREIKKHAYARLEDARQMQKRKEFREAGAKAEIEIQRHIYEIDAKIVELSDEFYKANAS